MSRARAYFLAGRAWNIAFRLGPLVAIALTLAAGQRWR